MKHRPNRSTESIAKSAQQVYGYMACFGHCFARLQLTPCNKNEEIDAKEQDKIPALSDSTIIDGQKDRADISETCF